MQSQGALNIREAGHVDASVSGANFAVVIGHREDDDDSNGHVIVDHVQVWEPRAFPDGRINHEVITAELERLITRFRLAALTFDQFNSAGRMDRLRASAREQGHATAISERTTTQPSNKKMYEVLKTALNRGLVHSPPRALLETELRNLELRNGRVDAPTRGPVRTRDVADCLANLTEAFSAATAVICRPRRSRTSPSKAAARPTRSTPCSMPCTAGTSAPKAAPPAAGTGSWQRRKSALEGPMSGQHRPAAATWTRAPPRT